MIGAMEKGVTAAKLSAPPSGVYEGVDLKVLPKYICFRAAMLSEKLTQRYITGILAAFFGLYFVASRIEIHSLHTMLRAKEYILAPGVSDFTPASAQSVPDSYVDSAVVDFLGQLGNVAPGNIDTQYTSLADSMSPQLRVRFSAEAADWKAKVKAENISELLTVTQKEIVTDGKGSYKVIALARRDTYAGSDYLGHADEVIEMRMTLVPPQSGKRWFLQITELNRQSQNAFRSKESLK